MSEKQEPIFPKGLIFKAPRDGAPEFVKGALSIKVEEFMEWLATNKPISDWISIDLKESKQGKYYSQLNTWKPEEGTQRVTLAQANDMPTDPSVPF